MGNFFGRFCAAALLAVLALSPFEAWAENAKVTFLHFNDVYEFQPGERQGGLAALKTLIDQEKQKDPAVLVTFGGDLLSPSVASSTTEGRHMVDFMKALGVDALALGNHEFDFGAVALRQRMQEVPLPWIASNVAEADGRPFGGAQSLHLMTANGVRVGFFSLLTASTKSLSIGAKEIVFTSEIETARASVQKLRQQGAELVVALTHLDLEEDRRLVREVKGIDLVLGGHDHNAVALEEEGVLIVKAGENASHLAVVEMDVRRKPGQAGAVARPLAWRFVPTLNVAPDAKLWAMTVGYAERLNAQLDQELAVLETPLDSGTALVRGRETAIGNLVADALRASLQADVALLNGGGFRGNHQYEKGHAFSRSDVLREFPFRNAVTLIEIDGADLRNALENGVSQAPSPAGRFPQISGMSFAYDPNAPVGHRVGWVQVQGRPLDPKGRYRLATNSYLLQGGDDYETFKKGRILVDPAMAPLMTTMLIDYLAQARKISARIEGRIKVKGAPN